MCEVSDWERSLFGPDGGLVDGHRRPWISRCKNCGARVAGHQGCESFDHTIEGRCDWGNCAVKQCPECYAVHHRFSDVPAGYPDCPCYGGKVRKLRWPWTSHKFVDAYFGYHMWAFDIRVNAGRTGRLLLAAVPYRLFGHYTGAVCASARLHDREFFRRKTVTLPGELWKPVDGSAEH